jgi:hypothetical protein
VPGTKRAVSARHQEVRFAAGRRYRRFVGMLTSGTMLRAAWIGPFLPAQSGFRDGRRARHGAAPVGRAHTTFARGTVQPAVPPHGVGTTASGAGQQPTHNRRSRP